MNTEAMPAQGPVDVTVGQAEKPNHPSFVPFKCTACGSSYFGPIFAGGEHVGRYCKGWPSGCDRSYNPCRGKHEEMFVTPNVEVQRDAQGLLRGSAGTQGCA